MQTGKAISIPSILKVGNGTLNKIGEYLKSEELTSVVIFMGNGLIDMFGDAIMKSLSDADITVLEYSELDIQASVIWCQRLQRYMIGFLRKSTVQVWSMTSP